jgi:hypothetical protein
VGTEEREIQHVIGFTVSDVEELPIGPARYVRTFRIRTLLGEDLMIRLRSENRLGLTLEHERENPVIPKQRLQRRKDDSGKGRSGN